MMHKHKHKHKHEDHAMVVVNGTNYKKHRILADVNVPSKFSIDRRRNKLFFCINGDESSDQSFRLVILDLDTELTSIIPGIRNGFASAVDPEGIVYLGGSDGIFQYNYDTRDVDTPAVLNGVDIFDMHFHEHLYFVETANQNLFQWKDNQKIIINRLKGYGVHHFIISNNDDILFVSATGVFTMRKGAVFPYMFAGATADVHSRGLAADVYDIPHLIAQDGIYLIDTKQKSVKKILPLDNGFGLAFDKDNNIIYSEERSVTILIRQIDPYFLKKS